MHPLLEIINLKIGFEQDAKYIPAVQGISFRAEKGKITAIVGESGSGKSVTALSILQLLPKTASITGEILFSAEGEKQAGLVDSGDGIINYIRGNKIAMIFQEPMTSLNPLFTCGYQVMEALVKHKGLSAKEAKLETIRLFEQVELPDPASMADRYPHQVSGGQKQRVMIAMAMSCGPSLLIADEPTTALDVRVQKNIMRLIKGLQQKNDMGVLFITHDLGLVADFADELLVMHQGLIVEQGNAAAILDAPQHPYTKALLACRPSANAKGSRLPVISDFLEGQATVPGFQPASPATKSLSPPQVTLCVDQLRVYFPAAKSIFGKATAFIKAVDDVSFEMNKGEITGLVGESGCGKSTLGRAILQLIKPTSGRIRLNDTELTTMSERKLREMRQHFQIVFQDPYGSLNPRISIGNAILETLKVHDLHGNNRNRKEYVAHLLEKVQLPASHYDRYPHQFSGGQRQRICIARALATDPSFLVFDESVSALDVSVQATILNLVNELKDSFHFTALFISHDISVVHHISDRILVMQKGKIIEAGSAAEIYFNPKQEYTQLLIDAIPGKSLVKRN